MSDLPPRPFVFLACSPADRAIATRLKTDLQAHGINTWTDQNLQFDADFQEEEITRVIQAADVLLVVASPYVQKSQLVNHALQIAYIYQRPVLPLSVDRDMARYEEVFASLIQSLRARAGIIPNITESF
jgi:hypothetical protein